MKWEKEIKIVKGLRKLYPVIDVPWGKVDYDRFVDVDNNFWKVWWLYWLCVHHLKQRMASLEGYMKYYNQSHWHWYKAHFGIEE